MIMVREVFIAKPGMASKLAKMFKGEGWEGMKVLTDMTGVFNKVVLESEYESLADYEAKMKQWMEKKDDKPSSGPSHTEMYTQGKREVYRIW